MKCVDAIKEDFYRPAQNFVRKEWHITKGPAFIGT
jgi:hypothetical protein